MMKLFPFFLTSYIIWGCLFCVNPVAIAIMMVILSFSLLFLIFLSGGSSWLPLIFVLLFVGGILMMFMILSSLMPNQKIVKYKTYMVPIAITSWIFNEHLSLAPSPSQLKTHLSLSWFILLSLVIVLGFFFSFIEVMKMDEMSMRSVY